MKIFPLFLFATMAVGASAQITVTLPAEVGLDSVAVHSVSITKLVEASNPRQAGLVNETLPVTDHRVTITIPDTPGGTRYGIELGGRNYIDLAAAPGEKININVVSLNPLVFTAAGSDLLTHSLAIDALQPANEDETLTLLKDYFQSNINNEGAIMALIHVSDPETYLDLFAQLPESASSSIYYPIVRRQAQHLTEAMEKERAQNALVGQAAPSFTLNDPEGHSVTPATDLKGRWVILDFWGSWCPWCIKGFPELKEAYTTYKDSLSIVGIDCRESQEAWLKGIQTYELPWVNLYNPSDGNVTEIFNVQGFPTKVIIDPQGMVRDITTGHDPTFFDRLKAIMEE